MRTFAAVFPPAEVIDELSRCVSMLQANGYDVKWVEPRNLHITVRFFGDVEEALLPQLKTSIEGICAGMASFQLRVEGVGTFPEKGNPRVLWAGLTRGKEELVRLSRAVEDIAVQLGFPPERFTAHLTLGRVRSPIKIGDLKEDLRNLGGKAFGEFRVNEVRLMKSELSRWGPTYSELASFHLS